MLPFVAIEVAFSGSVVAVFEPAVATFAVVRWLMTDEAAFLSQKIEKTKRAIRSHVFSGCKCTHVQVAYATIFTYRHSLSYCIWKSRTCFLVFGERLICFKEENDFARTIQINAYLEEDLPT